MIYATGGWFEGEIGLVGVCLKPKEGICTYAIALSVPIHVKQTADHP